MDKRNIISIGALGCITFFAFGSVSEDDVQITRPEIVTEAVEASVDGTPDSIGLAECDAYIKRYRCYLTKKGLGTQAAEQTAKSYKQTLEQTKGMGDVGKKAISQACTQGEDSMKAMFEAEGC